MRSKELALLAYVQGYRVLCDGTVRAPRGNFRVLSWRKDGYATFTVNIPKLGSRSVAVHRLVAYQKFGEEYMADRVVARHRDGNPRNNEWDNILIGTQSDNMLDRSVQSRRTHALLASRVNRKLSWDDVIALRKERVEGATYKELGKKYGITKGAISYIVHGKTYFVQ